MSTLKRGELVEFTDKWHKDYTLGDKQLARYGISTKEQSTNSTPIEVRTVKGIEQVTFIAAYGWGGWIPPELESIFETEFTEPWEVDWES